MSETLRKTGPNVKRLITRKMSLDAIPSGGGFCDALRFLTDPAGITSSARRAIDWVFAAIDAVKSAPDNHLGDDDEAIAGEIIQRLNIEDRACVAREKFREKLREEMRGRA